MVKITNNFSTEKTIFAISFFVIAFSFIGFQNAYAGLDVNLPGFEAPTLADGEYTPLHDSPPGEWTFTGGAGVFNPTVSHFTGEANGGDNTAYSNGGSICQNTTNMIEADTKYTLSVYIGTRIDVGTNEWTIELQDDALTTLASLSHSDLGATTPPAGDWAQNEVEADILTGDLAIGNFLRICLSSSGVQSNFDDVAINSESLKATLTIIKEVVNDEGGSAVPSDWTMEITGANPSSNNFPGSDTGVVVTIDPDTPFTVNESGGPSGYTQTLSADCDSAGISAGESATCTITNDDVEHVCERPITDFNVIVGTNGNDNLDGTDGDDYIQGLNGNDDIDGKDGNDCLIGGKGKDDIHGGHGDDYIEGNEGKDKLSGSNGNDTIFGGPGDDKIMGQNDDDTLHGDGGKDTIYGNKGDDTIRGGSGADKILGQNGDDTIFGNGGADRLYGNKGNDTIHGGGGADTIYGQNDDDILNGNGGDDKILGNKGDDTINGGGGTDDCSEGSGSDTTVNCES